MTNTIDLKPEQDAWIGREIAAGTFTSREDAVAQALDAYARNLERIRQTIDGAEAELARGDVVIDEGAGQDEDRDGQFGLLHQKNGLAQQIAPA